MSRRATIEIEPLERFRGLKTWPVTFDPRLQEDLESWFLRIALANGQVPSLLLKVIEQEVGRLRQKSSATAGRIVEYLAEKTRVDANNLWARARIYDGVLRRKSTTRLCPNCVAGFDPPRALREWQLPFALACVRHGTPLIDRCPVCEIPLRLMERSAKVPISHCEGCQTALEPNQRRLQGIIEDQQALQSIVLLCQTLDRSRERRPFFAAVFEKVPDALRSGKRPVAFKNRPKGEQQSLVRYYRKELQAILDKDAGGLESSIGSVLRRGVATTLKRIEPPHDEPEPEATADGLVLSRIAKPVPPDGPIVTLYELLNSYGEWRANQSGPSPGTEPAAR